MHLLPLFRDAFHSPGMQPCDDVLPAVNVERTEVGVRLSQKMPCEILALCLSDGRRRRPLRLHLGQRLPPIL